jgi:phage replication O-like protein O
MNPQKENGFTSIANELLEELIKLNLSGQELRACLFVIRKTYGFNKKEDLIALSQFKTALNIGKIRASQIVNVLIERNILTVTKNINGITRGYMFNKHYDKWQTVNKYINRKEKHIPTVNVLLNEPLIEILTTKDILTKDILQKKEEVVEIDSTIKPEVIKPVKKAVKKEPIKVNVLYTQLLNIYSEWFEKKFNLKIQFDGSDGNALKKIIMFLESNEPGDENVIKNFTTVLNNFDHWDKFYQKQTRIRQIESNLSNIITSFKNGNEKFSEQSINEAYRNFGK